MWDSEEWGCACGCVITIRYGVVCYIGGGIDYFSQLVPGDKGYTNNSLSYLVDMDPRTRTDETLKEHNIPRLDVGWFQRSHEGAAVPPHSSDPEIAQPPLAHDSTTTTAPVRTDDGSARRRNSIAGTTPTQTARDQQQYRRARSGSAEAEDSSAFAPQVSAQRRSDSNALRRTKSASVSTYTHTDKNSSQPPKKVGFFKSLFGGRRKSVSAEQMRKPEPQPQSQQQTQPQTNTQTPVTPQVSNGHSRSSSAHSLTRAKTESDLAEMKRSRSGSPHHHHHHHHHTDENGDVIPQSGAESPLAPEEVDDSTYSPDASSMDLDLDSRRLLQFLKYYKEKGYSVNAFKREQQQKDRIACNKLRHARTKATFSVSGDPAAGGVPSSLHYDARGRPIPAHPQKSPIPSAFTSESNRLRQTAAAAAAQSASSLHSADSSNTPASSGNNTTGSNKFGAFLRRVTSHGAGNPSENSLSRSGSTLSATDPRSKKFDPANFHVLPGLEDLKPLLHVSFATNTYFNDPPQQICSKNPRKGEVEVKPNGSVVIHRLSPQERRKVLQESTAGIVVGGSGQLKLLVPEGSNPDDANVDVRKQEERVPTNILAESDKGQDISPTPSQEGETEQDPAKTDERDTQQRTIEMAAAEAAAEARAQAAPNDLRRTVTNHEEEVKVSKTASHFTIDKPMVSRRSSGNMLSASSSMTSIPSVASVATEEEEFPPRDLKIPLDVVYTRCCHLREILPIPATMKQLTPGSTEPIPLLQLRNPRPSMVEIWSFSDFISIAPILCLSIDGVHLSVEMLRIILSSLTKKKNFEKLSLRNTPLDEEGWKILCYFISHNESLVSIDLTMVAHIKVNVQKPSKSSLKSTLKRMDFNKENRSDMNWNLLAAAIAVKGGLEEIILSGAKMNLPQFKNFIEVGCMKTSRLGLAYNELTTEQCQILARWIVHSRVTGLDIGFNDLRGKIQPFSDAMFNKIHENKHKNLVKYISLNNTNMEVKEGETSADNEFLKLLSILCFSNAMLFLDLSNNPKIFPHCIHTLLDCVPSFPALARLHLDFEQLDSTEIVMIAEMLPICPSLHHFSMVGTPLDLAASKALAEAVKKSTSLITLDLDYVYMPEKIKNEISLYSMRNIQTELVEPGKKGGDGKNPSDIPEPLETPAQLQGLREEFTTLLTETFDDKSKEEYDKTVTAFIAKVAHARKKIRRVVHDLFDLRVQGDLNIEGKEALIRLCIIDASLEKSIRLLKQRHGAATKGGEVISSTNSTTDDLAISNSSQTQLHPNETRPDNLFMSSTFAKSGHAVLLPFGSVAPESSTHKADEMVEFRDEAPARLVDPEIIQRKPTNDSGSLDDDEDDDNDHSECPSPVNCAYKEALSHAAQNSDSDQIKDFLLKNDVTDVLNVIDELHNQGYHFHHIFKKGGKKEGEECTHPSHDSAQPASSEGDKADTSTETTESIPSDDPHHSEYTKTQEAEAMNHAYDKVLDNLAKIRDSNKNLSADVEENL